MAANRDHASAVKLLLWHELVHNATPNWPRRPKQTGARRAEARWLSSQIFRKPACYRSKWIIGASYFLAALLQEGSSLRGKDYSYRKASAGRIRAAENDG